MDLGSVIRILERVPAAPLPAPAPAEPVPQREPAAA